MRKSYFFLIAACNLNPGEAVAQKFQAEIAPLIEAACIHCHEGGTVTRLNFEELDHDLANPATFRLWERIHDRVQKGEMPPEKEPRPAPALLQAALASLKRDLWETNLAQQRKQGRVASRRLTRLEYEYTMRDLLSIDDDLAKTLPEENNSGGFDTVGASQRISPIHVRSYLQAADQAIDSAINLSNRPTQRIHVIEYAKSPYVKMWQDKPFNEGGGFTKNLDHAVVLFVDLDYLARSDACGLLLASPGLYRIKLDASAYQAKTPVTLKLIRASEARGGAELLGAFDLNPDQARTVELTARLHPGDYLYPSVADPGNAGFGPIFQAGGAKNSKGPGVAVKSLSVNGPLFDTWPPASTQRLLTGLTFKDAHGAMEVELTQEPIKHVAEILGRIAPLAFRRPPAEGELDPFVALARPAIEEGRAFWEVLRVPLRSLLSSPQFLFFGGEPGALDDFALASRLSYFLWRSLPDEELFRLAGEGKLAEPEVLARQVDRMLDDEKSSRFTRDFLGQWLGLHDINATTPDKDLYPEFDELLNQSLARETELFFGELIKENLGVGHLIDSDFTFLNRRLAEHYGISGVQGQEFRKVTLPEESPRGGVLTHASILKITANGTVTSPVKRGNFVLTNLLGLPPDPPPPNVGSIEPDTRGTTTIRETLAAHRNEVSCARCHREIDPPGFALESFDPIGGFRTKYRATGGGLFQVFRGVPYKNGPAVDASGVTADGKPFSGVGEFKGLLLERRDQVARNFIAQLIVYATGAEIQFADRERVSEIAERTRDKGYPVRTLIHEVVQSELFRNQ